MKDFLLGIMCLCRVILATEPLDDTGVGQPVYDVFAYVLYILEYNTRLG